MRAGRTVIGLILIVLGVLFLLDAAGVLAAGPLIADWWPLALILIAAVQLITTPRAWLIPAIVIVVGLILLGATHDVLPIDAGTLFGPLVLIAIGVGFLLGHRIGHGSPVVVSDREVNAMAAFGGNDIVSQSTTLQGGSLVAAFRGVTLDLRGAEIDPAGAVIDATAAFGGIDILVPEGWRVTASGIPIFGGFESKTKAPPPSEDVPNLTRCAVSPSSAASP